MKIKSTTAFAIIKKSIRKINPMQIYKDKDIEIGKDELLIKVRIEPLEIKKK